MNEKVLAVVRPTAFTSHYTVQCSDGMLQVRTVHTCPSCGLRRLIVWSDDNSMLFADLIFGFRSNKKCGTINIQSYCRQCRSAITCLTCRSFPSCSDKEVLKNG